ncbi:MAG: hypothetical protein H6706_27450 [Myxococcales bacterium]|nr:hypothetical protein [Myxococcales bacterium]
MWSKCWVIAGLAWPAASAAGEPTAAALEARASAGGARRLLGLPAGGVLGVTVDRTAGRFARAGADVGVAAAGALCAVRFGPGARLCTAQDVHSAAAAKRIAGGLPQCWVFAASWLPPVGGLSLADTQGEAANCAAGTDAGPGRGVSATFSPTGGLLLNGNTPCGTVLPIACCR